LWGIDASLEELRKKIRDAAKCAVPKSKVAYSNIIATRYIWVMEDDTEVAGWLSFGLFYNGRPAYHATSEISVYVSERHRRRGVGNRLVQRSIDRSPTLSLKRLTAGVQGHNKPSIEFFKDFGFECWARFPGVAELDGMERDLVVMGLKVPVEGTSCKDAR
jgi:L-amino acid N-acyltransferase YncA